MRTLLCQFCESFERIVRPLLEPLTGSAQALTEASPDLPGKEVRSALLDLRHQVETLVEKVAGQQAYVLIFGPLKSGKSTLMNALAGTYVSEVSSLPAYPCMLYLSHSEDRQFDLTRYNGRRERFTDPAALYMHINRAHGELADRLRRADEAGEAFDPLQHYPEAIRKIEVHIPAGELDHSGAVLVDTPGLYSRMKFGYDLMTREFRDAASCAIFIVKSDNLFLEQVFEEFEDLLDLFSRIFLVVNLDTSKRDLSPDGTLVPSLEQEDPLRIIDAFENLAMSAPLKEAAEEGRLRIYPVDLLQAASGRLKGRRGGTEPPRGQANFDAFLRDLTEYLNSTEYLVAFLGDSMRRAQTLLSESTAILDHPSVEELRRRTDELDSARQDAQRRRHAVQHLMESDWRSAFDEVGDKLAPSIRERAKRSSEETERRLDNMLQRWFESDASLVGLIQENLIPGLRAYQEELARFVQKTLEDEVQAGTSGIRLPSDISTDLFAAEVDLNRIGKESLQRITSTALLKDLPVPLHSTQVPIRRSIWDWILLRSTQRIRDRVLGEPNNPNLRIPAEAKARRLGEEALAAIRRELDVYKGRFFHDTVQHIQQHVIGQYALAAADAMGERLRERDEELDLRLDRVVTQLMEHRKVLAHLSTLRTQTERATGSIAELEAQYGGTEPEQLIEAIDTPEVTLTAVPGILDLPRSSTRLSPVGEAGGEDGDGTGSGSDPRAREQVALEGERTE